MKRKKLKFMDINEEDVLNRDQMRNIMAGAGGMGSEDGYGSSNCLTCETPNGVEQWYRSDTTTDPDTECQNIYRAYGSGVSGTYGICGAEAHCS